MDGINGSVGRIDLKSFFQSPSIRCQFGSDERFDSVKFICFLFPVTCMSGAEGWTLVFKYVSGQRLHEGIAMQRGGGIYFSTTANTDLINKWAFCLRCSHCRGDTAALLCTYIHTYMHHIVCVCMGVCACARVRACVYVYYMDVHIL